MDAERKDCSDIKRRAQVYDYCLNELSIEERQAFEEHLFECRPCREETVEVSRLFRAMRENSQSYEEAPQSGGLRTWLRLKPGWAWAMIGGLFVIALCFLLGPRVRPAYYALAIISNQESMALRTADTYQGEVLHLYRQGAYEKAREKLEEYLKYHPEGDYDTYYLMGLCCLLQAQKSFFGVPYRFDTNWVDKGIESLKQAADRAPNAFALEEAYWYLGKAYLMKGEKERACGYFQKILDRPEENLIRKKSVRGLLDQLHLY